MEASRRNPRSSVGMYRRPYNNENIDEELKKSNEPRKSLEKKQQQKQPQRQSYKERAVDADPQQSQVNAQAKTTVMSHKNQPQTQANKKQDKKDLVIIEDVTPNQPSRAATDFPIKGLIIEEVSPNSS